MLKDEWMVTGRQRLGAVECQEQQFSKAEAGMGKRRAVEAAASERPALPPQFIGKAFAHLVYELLVAQL